MENDILMEILTTLKDFRAEEERRWEENDRRWEQNEKRWEENERRWEQNELRWADNDKHWEQNERRWEENERRWEQNELRWIENDKRWEQNERRWEENEKRWEQNELRWADNDKRWKQCNGDIFNIKEEFKRFYEIMDKNFQALSDKLDSFIKYSNFEHQKLELRLKKIESSQRYFEKVQNVHQELIDIQNIKFNKLMKDCKVS